MIKFFRKIRQKLLAENRFSKYLIYALGEIILVMIGILMALQINNWNEAKKAKEKERQVLIEIISDLDYTLENADFVLNKRANNLYKSIRSIKLIIDVIETNQPFHDSLASNFRAANSYDFVDIKTSGYQSLISIGTDLIEDPTLRSTIGKFYTASIAETKEVFDEVKLDFHEYMLDYYRKEFRVPVSGDERINGLYPRDFEALKKNIVYIQSLRSYLDVNQEYLRSLLAFNEEMIDLKKEIEDYLK